MECVQTMDSGNSLNVNIRRHFKPWFVFCSDEEPDQSVYSGLPVHFMEKSTMMTDLHILSLVIILLDHQVLLGHGHHGSAKYLG